jgi:UDP-2-acetamido-3-amino-2,3-dideoxy-glucuronate N-acetyltransferase
MSVIPRVAVAGCGPWGKNHVRNFAELGALAAVCDIDPERAAEFGQRFQVPPLSFAQMLRDPEIQAVVLATPAEQHHAMAREALLAGKDVLVEKPLALRAAEGEELHALASEHGRILMVGHLLLYHPAMTALKELVSRGELGKLHYLYSTRTNLGTVRREENILWSFAPHDLSVILWLLGERAVEVTAVGGNYLHPHIADVTVTTLAFPSGVRAHVFVSWLHPYKEQRLAVIGERAMVSFDDVAAQDKLLLYRHTMDWVERRPVPKKAPAAAVPFDVGEPLRRECEHFLACVAERHPPLTDAASAVEVLRVLEACQRSLERGGRPERVAREATFFAHETAVIDDPVEVGEGTRIWHFTHVQRNARIGRNAVLGQNVLIGPGVSVGDGVHIQNNVSVYAGVTLEDHVFIGPSAVFTNVRTPRSEFPRKDALVSTLVRRGASIGANATLVCGVRVGRYALVGAGAVVTHDVPDHALVLGNPARVAGWVCACGLRLEGDPEVQATCPGCGRSYRRAGDGLTENK